MDRIYHPYYLWEDVNNGILKEDFSQKEIELLTNKAKSLLINSELFYNTALKVICNWKYSSEQQLSNIQRNRRAWLGQASCCYKYKIPEFITKYAWRMMAESEQNEANKVAEDVITIWEQKYA